MSLRKSEVIDKRFSVIQLIFSDLKSLLTNSQLNLEIIAI